MSGKEILLPFEKWKYNIYRLTYNGIGRIYTEDKCIFIHHRAAAEMNCRIVHEPLSETAGSTPSDRCPVYFRKTFNKFPVTTPICSFLIFLFAFGTAYAVTDQVSGRRGDLSADDVPIPDADGAMWMPIEITSAPASAQINQVWVATEIKHSYVSDLKVWVSAYYNGAWHDYVLHDRTGGMQQDLDLFIGDIHTWDGASPNYEKYFPLGRFMINVLLNDGMIPQF